MYVAQGGLDRRTTAGAVAALAAASAQIPNLVNITQPPYNADPTGAVDSTLGIQAALDSGRGTPVIVLVPAGTYKVAPPAAEIGNTDGACLHINYDNVTILGYGRASSIIKCYVSGDLDPNTHWNTPGGAVWRGHGIFVEATGGTRNYFTMDGVRLTGQCLRSSATWPITGTDPPFPASTITGDGWDITHKGVYFASNETHYGHRIRNCEIDGFKGELLYYGGSTFTNLRIENNVIHDSNADGISISADQIISGNEIYATSNGTELSPYNANIFIRNNRVHDNSKGITLTNQSDLGHANYSGWCEVNDNFFQNNGLSGIYLQAYLRNVRVSRNILVDSGDVNYSSWGQISASISFLTTVAADSSVLATINANQGEYNNVNIFIEDNLIGVDTRSVGSAILVGDDGTTDKHIRRNRTFVTPNAVANGFTQAVGVSIGRTGATERPYAPVWEVVDNDFRSCIDGADQIGNAIASVLFKDNIFSQSAVRTADARVVTVQVNSTSTVLTTVPELVETITKSLNRHFENQVAYEFEAVLHVSTDAAGGAQVAVSFSGNVGTGFIRYRVESWNGATLVAAGSTSTIGAVVGNATAVLDYIKITGAIYLDGTFSVDGTADGILGIQFAQNVTDVTASSILMGSTLKVRQGATAIGNSRTSGY